MINTVSIIGTGNVATWFLKRLKTTKIVVNQIYGRNIQHVSPLAQMCNASPITHLSQLSPQSDVFIFTLKDDCYPTIFNDIPFKMSLAVHSAGSISAHIFHNNANNYGVIYPYQSISKELINDTVPVPLCVEGNSESTAQILLDFAKQLSPMTQLVNEKQRFALHVAAVFANNFTNALFDISYKIVQDNHLDWQFLLPLIQQTCLKIETTPPLYTQTGPAKRNDLTVMKKQIDFLNNEAERDIYKLISSYIISRHSLNNNK